MDVQKELNEWADWFIPHDSKDLRDALELNSFNQLNVEKLLAINGLSEAYVFRAKDSWKAWQAAKAQAVPECTWMKNEDGYFDASCGQSFVFSEPEDKPSSHEFTHCCFCGGKLIEAQEPAND